MGDAWIYGPAGEEAREIAPLLAELGYSPRLVAANGSLRPEGADGRAVRPPALAIVLGGDGEEPGAGLCARLLEDEALGEVPLVVALEPDALAGHDAALDGHELIVRPFTRGELQARIARARRRINGIDADDIVRLGRLELNLATYQVSIDGAPVDFTFMEYELLRFLATHPGRVFTREALLNRVWGYDYYGGARTVDVHVRRVRAKLGTEHGAWIKTVRSVGYRFDPGLARGRGR